MLARMSHILKPPCDEAVVLAAPANTSTASTSAARAVPLATRKQMALWVLVATILGSSMAFIDGTVVNVALPVLQTDLHATATDVQWVVEAYALFLSALILVGGSLGDHLRPKADLRPGHFALHAGVGILRPGAERQSADCGARLSRHWRRLVGARQPGDYQRFL